MSDTGKDDAVNQQKRNLLKKLIALRTEEKVENGFHTKPEFLNWGARVEPLLSFDPAYQEQFGKSLHMIHAPLSSMTVVPLADVMKTVLTKAIEKLKYEADLMEDKKALDVKQVEENMPDTKKVFVVHGRDNKLRKDFFSFLRAFKLEPIEWSEAIQLTGEGSPYIGDVLEKAFNVAQAVVVLLSPDDEVRLSPTLCHSKEDDKETKTQLQARPNVLFEAGMAMGKDPKRTILIEVGKVKEFSDIGGRHVIRLTNAPERRKAVAQRLKAAGCEVSMDGDDWLSTGVFTVERTVSDESLSPKAPTLEDLTSGDIIALLTDWWPKSSKAAREGVTVNYSELDQLLRLPSGSTKRHINIVASKKSYRVVSSGNAIASYEYHLDFKMPEPIKPMFPAR